MDTKTIKTLQPIEYKPIGFIYSPFKEPKGVPIQSSVAKGVEGKIIILPEYQNGLKDIEGFSHIILIYHFHMAKFKGLMVKPYMDNKTHGVFATRAPSRPNPIGLSVVRLIKRENNILFIEDVDIIDNTPLLDIKPFVPEFDARDNCRIGWLSKNIHKLPSARDDERFAR